MQLRCVGRWRNAPSWHRRHPPAGPAGAAAWRPWPDRAASAMPPADHRHGTACRPRRRGARPSVRRWRARSGQPGFSAVDDPAALHTAVAGAGAGGARHAGSPVGLRLGATAVRRVPRELRVAPGGETASARLLVGRLRLLQAGCPVLLRLPAVAVSALLLVVLLRLCRFFRGPCSRARCCRQRCDGGKMDEGVHVSLPGG